MLFAIQLTRLRVRATLAVDAMAARKWLRACLAGLNLKSWSSLTSAPASRLRRMTLRACRSMIVGQLKSWEPYLTVGTQAGGCLRKRNSAKQTLKPPERAWRPHTYEHPSASRL